MKPLEKIIVPTDLSERSRRAVEYAAGLAVESKGELIIMHVANEFVAWELHDDLFGYSGTWPLDRVLTEAAIELNRFLDCHSASLSKIPILTKRLVFGSVPEQLVLMAEEEKADLIVLSPRPKRGWQSHLMAGTTEKVSRMSPCPVLSIAPPLPSAQWRGKVLPMPFCWSRPSVETV